jgi:5,10-methylenetetrahydrofolate reductase
LLTESYRVLAPKRLASRVDGPPAVADRAITQAVNDAMKAERRKARKQAAGALGRREGKGK